MRFSTSSAIFALPHVLTGSSHTRIAKAWSPSVVAGKSYPVISGSVGVTADGELEWEYTKYIFWNGSSVMRGIATVASLSPHNAHR